MELVEKLLACFFGCSCKGDARSRNLNPWFNPDPPTRTSILITLPNHYTTPLTQADWGWGGGGVKYCDLNRLEPQ